MYKQIIGLASVLLVAYTATAGNIYKWNENGKTMFGQFPPPGITATPVKVSKRSPRQNAGRKTPQDRLEQLNNQKNEKTVQKEMQQEQAKYVKARELNCNKARHNLNILQAGGHHRVQQPDGTIKYLDEVETASKISSAKKDIKELCSKPELNTASRNNGL